MDGHEVNALFRLALDHFKNIFCSHLGQSLPLLHGLNGCFINGNGSYGDGRMTNDLLADGINISTRAQIHHGIRPSLSVDVECNMTADMFTNMRAAFTVQRALANQRAIEGDRTPPRLLTARETIELATIVGAEDAHLGSKIGTLTPGKDADIILLATDRINVFPLNNVPGTVVTMMDTSNVDSVFIAGRIMKWRGELVGVDLARIRRLIDQARDGLLSRAKAARNLFDSCCAPG